MSVREVQVTFDCADPGALCDVLGRGAGLRADAAAAGLRLLGRGLDASGCPPSARNGASACEDPDGVGPAAVLPAGARGQDREEPGPPRRPGRSRPEGDDRMAALEAECERLVALGATRVERHEPGAADGATASS